MNVFVTGGTGFVGTHLVRALERRGDRITCLVRDGRKAAVLGWQAVRIVEGDLDSAGALREGCTGAEVVFHVAGRISAHTLHEFMTTNRDGTAAVLEAAADTGSPRVVYVSSLAVGGPSAPGRPVDERGAPAPVTDYGRSKLAGELLVRASGLPWTVVRPPVVYGEWDREILKVFQLARRGIAPVFGNGSQQLSVIHAGDLATALIAAGSAPRAAGRVYYAAHPHPTTSRDFASAIGRAVGTTPRVVPIPGPVARGALWVIGAAARLAGRATVLSADKANEFLAPGWTCSSAALTADTGWRAEIDLEPGLRRTAEWYRAQGWLK